MACWSDGASGFSSSRACFCKADLCFGSADPCFQRAEACFRSAEPCFGFSEGCFCNGEVHPRARIQWVACHRGAAQGYAGAHAHIAPASRVAPTTTPAEATALRRFFGRIDGALEATGSDGSFAGDVPLDSFKPPLSRAQFEAHALTPGQRANGLTPASNGAGQPPMERYTAFIQVIPVG